MITGKNIRKNINKINTIISNSLKSKYIIVFILVYIFSMGIGLLNTVYADTESKKNSTNSRFITLKNDMFTKGKIVDIEVNIRCSLNNNAKMYSYSEVAVEFKNPGSAFRGILQLGIPQNEEGVLYTKDIEVPENSSKTEVLYIPINIQTEKLDFEILDRSGKSLLKEDINIKVYSQEEVMVGILAEKPESVNYIAADNNSTYFYFSKDTMPTDYKALDAINVLIINRYKISELSANQYVAITDWVRNGGTLVLGTGDGAAGYLGTFANKYGMSVSGVGDLEISFVDRTKDNIEELVRTKLTEDGYSIDDNIWNNFWTAYSEGNYQNQSEGVEIGLVAESKVANISIISAYVEFVKKYWITTQVAEITANNGITIESASSVPIMQSIIDGKGKVIVASFDLGIDEGNTALREQISTTILSYAAIDDKTIYNQFLTSILGSAKGKVPNTIVHIIILSIYVIVLLGTIIIMNKKNKTKKLVKIIPIYSIIVCALFAVMGIGTRIKGIHSSYFTITELQGDGKAELEKYFDVTVPKNKIYKLSLKQKNDIYSVNTSTRNTSLVSSDNDSFNTYITSSNSGVDVRFDGISTFDTKTFTMNETVEAADKFEASLNCWENVYSGAINNNTSFDYEHIFVVTKTAVLYIGDMSKGEKVSETKIKHMNYTSLDELEYIIPNLLDKDADNQNSVDSKGTITPNGITRTMQYYMMSRGLSGTNRACIFAIAKNSSDLFTDENIKEEGINVVTTEFDVNYVAGEQRYIPNICISDISYELGNYNYSTTTGSVYVVNNTIADFYVNSSEKLTSLTFTTSSKEKKKNSRNFEGKVCFWNYSTNKYDEIFISSEDKTITDFTNYLGSNNMIKIKFEVGADDIGYNVPIISAILSK